MGEKYSLTKFAIFLYYNRIRCGNFVSKTTTISTRNTKTFANFARLLLSIHYCDLFTIAVYFEKHFEEISITSLENFTREVFRTITNNLKHII